MLGKNFILVLALAALAGCSSPAAPDSADPGTDPSSSGPNVVGIPPGAGALSANNGTIPTLTDLTAAITAHTGGMFSDYGCTVEVTNGSSVQRTGHVTVTFVHAGKPESGSPPQTQDVTVPPNGKLELTFKDNAYHFLSEDATVQVTTDPAPGTSATTTQTSSPSSGTPGTYPSPPPGGYGATN